MTHVVGLFGPCTQSLRRPMGVLPEEKAGVENGFDLLWEACPQSFTDPEFLAASLLTTLGRYSIIVHVVRSEQM